MSRYDVVILGAGVIGLSAALELVQAGYSIAIAAKDLPEDSDSFGFASPWAGCNWHTFEDDGDSPAAKRDARTYVRLADLARDQPDLCKKIEFVDVFSQKVPAESRWNKDLVGGIREATQDTYPIPARHPHAHVWQSYILHAPNYILHLSTLLRKQGVTFVRARISSLDEAYDLPGIGPVDIVVNATGLGSRSLIGVEDEAVHPARGQTVLVRAPGIDRCIMQTEGFMGADDGPSNQVILGGTYIPNSHSCQPDLKEAERIMKACFDLEPRLAPKGGSWRDIEVISHNVGLRPAREGGARVELERRRLGQCGRGIEPARRGKGAGKGEVGVVHAYGFGSAGFQASLGAAEEVLALVQQYKAPSKAHGREAKL